MQLPKISSKAIGWGALSVLVILINFLIRIMFLGGADIWLFPTHPEGAIFFYLIFFNAVAAAYFVSGYMIGHISEKVSAAVVCSLIVLAEFYFITNRYDDILWMKTARFIFIAIAILSAIYGAYIVQKKSQETAYYTVGQTTLVALISGALAACWLVACNYQVLGQKDKAYWTMICGIIFCVYVAVLVEILTPQGNYVIMPSLEYIRPSFLYFAIIFLPSIFFYFLAKSQKKILAGIIAAETKKQSNWRMLGICLVFIILSLYLFFGTYSTLSGALGRVAI